MPEARQELVENLEEVEENIVYLEAVYREGGEELQQRYRGLIAGSRHFFCSEVDGVLTFAPSRMIGYRSNTFAKRDRLGEGSGTVTSQRLNRLVSSSARNAKAERAFHKFCSSRGITPANRAHQRRYWIIGKAERLIAEICEEAKIFANRRLDETTRQQLIAARVGQGQFRQAVSDLWDGKCAVTGCVTPELLRASHIKPWASSDNRERLDPLNGLLLAAHVDALFDRGLISFEDDGTLLYSSQIAENDKAALNLPEKLGRRIDGQKAYLEVHRETIFRRDC